MAFLEDIHKSSECKIPFKKENVFCFDNEAFRYLVIKQNKFSLKDTEKDEFSSSWEVSSRNSMKLLEYICTLQVMDMESLISLNTSRQSNTEWAKVASRHIERFVNKKNQVFKEKQEFEKKNKIQKNSKEELKAYSDQLQKISHNIDKVLDLSLHISTLIRKSSVAVFNDDFEAYLEEIEIEESKKPYAIPEYKSLASEYKNILEKYKKAKKTPESKKINQKSSQSCKASESQMIEAWFNQLLDLKL